MFDPYFIGYYIGEVIADVVIVSTGSVSLLTGYSAVKSFARTHALVDKSITSISNNLFECLPYID